MASKFTWDDPFVFEDRLGGDEKAVRDAAAALSGTPAAAVLMVVRHETSDREVMTEMGELGLPGSTIEGYEFPVIRHMINLQTVNPCQGTHGVHALILDCAQTGLQAFS